jgi:hypothetical protein
MECVIWVHTNQLKLWIYGIPVSSDRWRKCFNALDNLEKSTVPPWHSRYVFWTFGHMGEYSVATTLVMFGEGTIHDDPYFASR